MVDKIFSVGDRVRFRLGKGMVSGVVKEDRGPIGVHGRRLYLVEYLRTSGGPPSLIEIPAEELHFSGGVAVGSSAGIIDAVKMKVQRGHEKSGKSEEPKSSR
jgi:hypothetical protein